MTDLTLRQGLITALAGTARALQTHFDAQLREMGLTAARGRVLLFLAKRGPEGATQTDVTDYLRVENPTAVRILDGLEALGHIRRRPSETDRRAKIIELTDTGRPIAEAVVRESRRLYSGLLDDISDEDLETIQRVLDVISAKIVTAGPVRRWAHFEREAAQ
ncbi:MAG: MarR family transcriptional regulator [Devosia nanyangense]|jgi:MarR family transcriptional regulator for hemolysin|nr:MarR family transcriptional regulator [Devosia nanyangense]